MWDLPGPGLEPMGPALAGGFLATEPPGKPLMSVFLILVFLIGMQWYLIAVLTCIYSLANDTEHLFMCYFAFGTSSSVKCLVRSFTWIIWFFNIEFWKSFICSRYYSFFGNVACKYFSPCNVPFYPLHMVFHRAKFFNFNEVQFINFSCYRLWLWC